MKIKHFIIILILIIIVIVSIFIFVEHQKIKRADIKIPILLYFVVTDKIPYGAYTKESVWALKMNGINMQMYDIGMNYFNNFNKDYIKRINIPCEMT